MSHKEKIRKKIQQQEKEFKSFLRHKLKKKCHFVATFYLSWTHCVALPILKTCYFNIINDILNIGIKCSLRACDVVSCSIAAASK